MNDGTVQCWGTAAQLGYPAQECGGFDAYHAYPVPGLEHVGRVDAGPDTTCAVTRDRSVYCWGYNIAGQVPWAVRNCRVPTPELAKELSGAIDVAVGESRVCAATAIGVVRCSTGEVFQTPTRSAVRRLTREFALFEDGTVRHLHGGLFKSPLAANRFDLAANEHFFCALDASNRWACPSTLPFAHFIPAVVDLAPARAFSFRSLSLRDEHACGVTQSGDLVCWGSNAFGQLGRGAHGHCEDVSIGDYPVPCAGPGVVDGISDVVQVAVSQGGTPARTCALSRDGTVKCWGEKKFRPAETDEALEDPPMHRVVFSPPLATEAPPTGADDRSCRYDGVYGKTPRRAILIPRCAPATRAWSREDFYRLARKHVGKRVRFTAPLAYRPCDDPYYCVSVAELWLGRQFERPRFRTALGIDPRCARDHCMPAARGQTVIAEGRLELPTTERGVGFVLQDYRLCEM